MTRLLEQIREGSLTEKVTVAAWDGHTCEDVIVCGLAQIQEAKRTCPASSVLAAVEGVAARFHRSNPLPTALDAPPSHLQEQVDSAVTSCKNDLQTAQERGADGVSYLVFGADPDHATPMQYGGLFLEHDREVLDRAKSKGFVEAMIAPADETYYDFLTDLPSDLISAPAASETELQEMAEISSATVASGNIERRFTEVTA